MRRPLLAPLAIAMLATAWGSVSLAPRPALASPFAINAQLAKGSAVLGLDGNPSERAAALTEALRESLAARGQTRAQDMTLAELRLTMGCDDEDLACVAEGGKTLGVQELIYGTLEGEDGEYTLSLSVLDVDKAKVTNGLTTTLSEGDLDDDAIVATADDIVTRLLGPGPGAAAPAPLPQDEGRAASRGQNQDQGQNQNPERDSGPAKGKLVFGAERPVPMWKKVGLGASAGLTVASLGTAIGTAIALGPNGKLRRDLIAAAEASVAKNEDGSDVDGNPRNNVPPSGIEGETDLCKLAREEPADQPGRVTNAAMTDTCNTADAMRRLNVAGLVGTGVFGLTAVVFTVVTLTHREAPRSAAAQRLHKHQLRLGFAPGRDRFTVGAAARF